MRRILLLLISLMFLTANGQETNKSFLNVEKLELLGVEHTFLVPSGMRKSDNNGKPWAMIKIAAKGFDEKILADMRVFSQSSTLSIGNVEYDENDGCIKVILSSGVRGKIMIKYLGTTLEYTLASPLSKSRVYRMEITINTATVTILASSDKAKIYIDGEASDKSGYASKLVFVGEHTYSIECEDYVPIIDKKFVVDKDMTINVALDPLFGYVTVKSIPDSASLYVNGKLVGTTPYVNQPIKRGRNNIVLKKPLYRDYAELVNISPGVINNVDIVMISELEQDSLSKNFVRALVLELSEDSLKFGPDLSVDSIFVTTNSAWSFDSVPSWCSVYQKNNILSVTSKENKVLQRRYGDIVIYTDSLRKRLHVVQEEGRTILKSQSDSFYFDMEGGTSFKVMETNAMGWEVSADVDWIEASEKSDTLVVTCQENTDPISRSGHVNIKVIDKDMNVNVFQKAFVTAINIPSDTIFVDADESEIMLPVSSNVKMWWCTSNTEWLTALRVGDSVSIKCNVNKDQERKGTFVIRTGAVNKQVELVQKGAENWNNTVLIKTNPSWEKLYVDGVYVGRSPKKIKRDNEIHNVRCGNEYKEVLFNSATDEVAFHQGLRFITLTMSSETYGIMSGYIGDKRIGEFAHVQINIPNNNMNPKSEANPLYMLTLGPTFDFFHLMSLYGGVGASLQTDTIGQHFGGVVEAGLMLYFRHVFLNGGVQVSRLFAGNPKVDFSAGLGVYFSRYYDKKYNYCSDMSRRYWSLNYVYNHVLNAHGIMFGDIGVTKVRGYIKTMAAFPIKDYYVFGLTTGIVFNPVSGFIDLMFGGGVEGDLYNSVFNYKGAQAEVGFVLNVWRFPITMMFRVSEIEKDTRYLSVDLGFGFSFKTKNKF